MAVLFIWVLKKIDIKIRFHFFMTYLKTFQLPPSIRTARGIANTSQKVEKNLYDVFRTICSIYLPVFYRNFHTYWLRMTNNSELSVFRWLHDARIGLFLCLMLPPVLHYERRESNGPR